ncbi:putative bifunctional inhibitor/plant lipid transfer protein/seed storage helical [Helianthus anomalus]
MLHSTSIFNFVSLNMSSKRGSINRLLPCLAVAVMMVFGVTKADLEQDKNQCTDKLVGLAPCLAYVGGDAPTPPKDCCTGLKQVVTNSMVCLCILVKDHNDPSLKLKINDTLALGLPDTCHTPANISHCVGLLHLKNGSPDAKVFEDYAKLIKNTTTTTIVQPAGTIIFSFCFSQGVRSVAKLDPNYQRCGVWGGGRYIPKKFLTEG